MIVSRWKEHKKNNTNTCTYTAIARNQHKGSEWTAEKQGNWTTMKWISGWSSTYYFGWLWNDCF
ncbi:hypothetical protein C1H46_018092 [Malus baccata]|uniref:Uncharacterized protein n=1 Tax=Malus baccata TaxID=106549 RepID=A0A540MC77_MALBA|nr:hypothetical protein C1H46_018092 [Malus baccata]